MSAVSFNFTTTLELGTTIKRFSVWVIWDGFFKLPLHFTYTHFLFIVKWMPFQWMTMVFRLLLLNLNTVFQSFSLHQWTILECFELIRSKSCREIWHQPVPKCWVGSGYFLTSLPLLPQSQHQTLVPISHSQHVPLSNCSTETFTEESYWRQQASISHWIPLQNTLLRLCA